MKNIQTRVANLAKNATLLIVDDSAVSLQMYTLLLQDIFFKVYNAKNGQEAYDIWVENDKNIDIIFTDIMMPVMNGTELVQKIRAESHSQNFLVLTSLDDLNDMKEIINFGVDGVLVKPYKEEQVFPILLRVLSAIKAKKILKKQFLQLQLLSKENITLKQERVPKEEITNKIKYNIRSSTTIGTQETDEIYQAIDYDNLDTVDQLFELIYKSETELINHQDSPSEDMKKAIFDSLIIFDLLVSLMRDLRAFEIASDSATHIIEYLNSLDATLFDDIEKRKLFLDVYLLMLEDIQKWLHNIFIEQDRVNISYFDASFANNCLELETVFNENNITFDDKDLEFF